MMGQKDVGAMKLLKHCREPRRIELRFLIANIDARRSLTVIYGLLSLYHSPR